MDTNLFQSLDSEKAILGLLISDDSFKNLIPQLIEEDFSLDDNRKLFRVTRQLYAERRSIDLVTVHDVLLKMIPEDAQRLAILAASYVGSIMLEKYHVKEYLAILKETAMRRKVLQIVEDTKNELLQTGTETSVALEKIRQKLRDVVIIKNSWESAGDVTIAAMNAIERKSKGEDKSMPSGISTLDFRTAGFQRGEFTIIGARPSVGKSAMGAHIAMATAEQGYKVGICSREMTDVQYGMRMLARESGVDNTKLRNGQVEDQDWMVLSEAFSKLAKLPMSFVFTTKYIEDLRMEVQKKVDAGELDMLIVDYAQLMQTRQRFEQDYQRIGHVTKMLKEMSTDFNISVIGLAQVGRSVENSMPTLADLRGSGDIEQDADNVIFMHRPKDAGDRYVHPDDKATFEDVRKRGFQYIALNVAKLRQGEIGTTCVLFDPSKMRYIPIERGTVN